MKKIAISVLFFWLFCAYESQASAPRVLDVQMSKENYTLAKQKLIEQNLIGHFADCAARMNATGITGKIDIHKMNNEIAKISAYCASELSFALDFHPKEFASFVRQLDEEHITKSLWLNSQHYKYHQKKLLENRNILSTELYAALSDDDSPEVVTVTCDSTCMEEASRLSNDGGMGVVIFSMVVAAGGSTFWGSTVIVQFSTHTEQWNIPMFGNKAYFVQEVPPGEAPILNPF